MSLRDCIRCGMNDQQLVEFISEAVKRKHAQHAGKGRFYIVVACYNTYSVCTVFLQIKDWGTIFPTP